MQLARRNGSIIAGVVVLLDVSERRRTENALKASEEMAKIALSAGQMGDWDLDLVTGSAHRSLRHDQCFGYRTLLSDWTYNVSGLGLYLSAQIVVAHQGKIHAESEPGVGSTFSVELPLF